MSFEVDLDSAVLESDYHENGAATKTDRSSSGFKPNAEPTGAPTNFSVDLESAELDEKANQGFIGTFVDGAKSAGRAISSAYNTYTGDGQAVVDNAKAQELANEDKSQDIKNFQSDWAANTGAGTDDEVGLWGAIKGTGKAIIDNPRGAALSVVEQFPNSVPTLAASWAGAKTGFAVTPPALPIVGPAAKPIGGIIGGIAGLFIGNTATETGHKAQEYAADGEFTPDEQSAAMTEGAKKAGATTAVDALTFGIGGKISSTMRRTAENAVEAATRKTLIDAGVDISDTAALAAARSNPQIASQVVETQKNAARIADSLRKRAAEAGVLLTLETIGEGLGEYLGELAATGQASVSEAVLESFLSLGQSGVQTMFNLAKARDRSLTDQEWVDAANGIAPEGIAPEQLPVADGIWDEPTPEAKIDMGQMQDGGVTPTPVFNPQDIDRNLAPTPSQQMGINPDAGPLSAAAAQSVDSGLFTGGFTPQAGINQSALEREGVTPPPVLDTDQIDRNLGSIDPLTGEYMPAPEQLGQPSQAGDAGNYEYDQWGNLSRVDGRTVEGYGQNPPRLGFNSKAERSTAPLYEVGPDGVARPSSGEAARSRKERIDLSSLKDRQQTNTQKQPAAMPEQRSPEQQAQSIWDSMNAFERNKAAVDTLGHRGVLAKNTATKAWDKLSAEQQAKLVSGLDAQQGQRWTDPNQKVTDQTGPVLQNRDRTSQDSINQMRSISNNPDYSRLKTSGFLSDGAPVVVDENIQIPASQMGVTDTASAGNERFNVQYAVVEADQLMTSNSIDGTTNAEYQTGAAGKARAIAGNGRITGLQSAWAKGNANKYKADMAADRMHGIDPTVIEGMRNPVLVRLLPQDQVTDNIGDLSNRDEKGRLSPVEQAKTDMGRIDLDSLKFTADGAIGGEAIHQFRMAQPAAERVTEAEARKRLTSAIFQKAYGNDQLTEIQSGESDDAKSILSALAQAAPSMSRLEGAGEFDIRPLITQAGIAAVNAARRGTKLADYVQQSEMGIDPMVYPILEMMLNENGNIRSSKYIGEQLTNMAKLAYDEANSPSSDMFGEKPKRTAEQVIQDALTGVQGYGQINDRRGQESLGQRGRSEPDAQMVEGPEGGRERPADIRQTAPTQPEAEQEQSAAVENNAPETWRSNYIQAAKIAREKGIDPKQHKKLADLVAAIDSSNTKPEAQTQLPAQQKQASGSVDGAKVHLNNSIDLTSALAAIARGAQLSTEPNGDVILSGAKIITFPKPPTSIDEVIAPLATALLEKMRADGVSMPGNPADMTRDQFAIAYHFANIIPEFEISGADIGGVVQGSSRGLTVDSDKLYDKIIEQAKEQAKPALELNQQTEESLAKDAKRLEQLQKEEAAQKVAQKAAERKQRERDADKARADEVVDDFQLGQSAEEVMSGMGDIFATESKPKVEPTKTPLQSLNEAIDSIIEEQRAIAEDWKNREYKDAKGSVQFEGDGPSTKGSMSINAINEGRRRKAIEQASNSIAAAKKLKDSASEGSGEKLLNQMALIYNKPIAGNDSPTTAEKDAMFEARFLRSIDFDGKQSGATQSNSISKAMLVAVKEHIKTKAIDKQKQIEAEAKLQKDFEADTRSTEELISDFFDDKTKQPTTKAPTEAIKDFGEKLEGARKDYASKLSDAKEVDIATEPLSKSWPEPNYQKLIDGGMPLETASIVRAIRDEIPVKPRASWRLKGWVRQVSEMRDLALNLMGETATAKVIVEQIKSNKSLSDIVNRADLYSAVGHDKSLKDISLKQSSYSLIDGVKYSPPKELWTVERPIKSSVISNMPRRIATAETREQAIAKFKNAYATLDESKRVKNKAVEFGVYTDRTTKDVFIGRKVGKNIARVKTGFETPKDAIAHLKENYAALEERFNKMKDTPDHRKAENSPRVGVDHRNGADVTPEQFSDTFGFRGVQFGNYVEQGRRQQDLNEAYDALMDMAGVLGIPAKSLSLNGELGLAFGARGKGGKQAAKAHYEPDQIVINLTKKNGAGSLAHEWWHALDNYFGRERGGKSNEMYASDNRAHATVRPEMAKAYRDIASAVSRTKLKFRSDKLDRMRTKPYWGTGIEMTARSFESYVIEKLRDSELSNDYLANIVGEDYWNAAAALGIEKDGTYPYPEAAEIPEIRAAYDNFFNTLETKEGEDGNVLLFSFAGKTARGADLMALDQAQLRIASGDNAETVRQETGWHRGDDGKWRFEISDDQAKLRVAGKNAGELIDSAALDAITGGRKFPVTSDLIDHAQLFVAYPKLSNIKVEKMPEGGTALARLKRRATGFTIQLRDNLPREKVASAILHELQHGIQVYEGFAVGGSKNMVFSDLDMSGAKAYRALAGEVEARNTQTRHSMTPALRRNIAPELTQDTPSADVIVTFNGKDITNKAIPNNVNNAPITDASLVRAFDVQFPRLTKAVRTMLARGNNGERGGVVVIDSADPLMIARAFAKKTGKPISQSVQMFSDAGVINGFFDPKSGLTFLVGPNLNPVTGTAVLLHEMIHGQQRQKIDKAALAMLMNRGKEKNAETRAFLDRVAARMDDAGETANAQEAGAYIVEQAVMEGKSAGYGTADSRFLSWVDQHIGKTVGDFLRSFIGNVRSWALRNGLPIGPITVDDLVSYAMAGMDQASRGNVDGSAGFSRDATGSLEDALSKLDALGLKHQISERNGVITVNKIEVPDGARGQGAGSAAMQALIDYADATGKHIALTPTAAFGGNKERLKKFYQRFGFKENKGKNKVYEVSESMVRENPDGRTLYSKVGAITNTPAFKRWFGDSKIVDASGDPLLVYHGSGAKFATFDKNKRGATTRAKSAEEGFFFTSSKSLAYDFKKQAEGAAADLDAIRSAVEGLSDSQLESLASDIGRIASEDLDLEGREFFIDSLMDMYQYDTDINTWPEESNGTPKVLKKYIPKDILEPGAVHDVYLRIENPHEHIFSVDDDWHDEGAITRAISIAKKNGNDGVILRNMVDVARADEKGNNAIRSDVYIAFEPDQIIQSEDSAGIRFSRSANPASISAAPNGMAAWDSPSASKFDDFVYKMQDKHVDTKRVIEAIRDTGKAISDDLDVYLQETLFHGRAAKRTQDFLNKEVTPLIEYMQSAKVEMSDLEEFLHARHAQEANALIAKRDPNMPDGGSGMTNAEAAKYLNSLNGVRRKQLENAAKFVDKIIGGTRETIVNYGLESQETVDGWTAGFKHYIPLQREDKDGQMGIGQGFSVKGKETKGRTGSTRKVVDILANVMMQRERAIVRGEKNRVAVALLGLAKDNPLPEFWQVDKVPTTRVLDKVTGLVRNQADPMYKSRDNAIVAKVNGQEHAILMNEDDPRAMRMAEALKNLDAAQLEGLLGATATATRYFAAVNTQYNPIFGVTNFVRDIQEAMLHLESTPLKGKQKEVFKTTFLAVPAVWRAERASRRGESSKDELGILWNDFQNVGGQTGFRDQFSNSADRSKEIQRALTPDGWAETGLGKFFTANGTLKAPLEVVRKKAAWMFDILSDYNTAMENGVRLAVYKAGIDAGLSKQQSAATAKGITVNFNRKGQATQQIGALYAFFNASVQGSARLGQSLFDMEPGKPKTMRLSKLGQRIVSGGVLLGASQAVLLSMMGFDDDEPPEFIRERNIIIPNPLSEKGYASIPMPLGYHVIANLGRIPTEFALGGGKDGAKHLISLLDIMSDVYNPLGSSGLSMQTIAPTVLDPLAALAENKDFSGRAIAKESFNRQTPGHALARDTASLPATWLAQVINYATGGTEFTRGEFSPTPDQIDYLVGQLTGGVGREVTKFLKTGQAASSGDDLQWHNVPLLGRFYGDADSDGAKQSAFYNNMDKVRKHAEEVKGLRAAGRSSEAIEYANKHPQAKLHLAARAAEKQVKDMRDRKRDLEQAGAPREEIRALEKRMVERMEQFVELAKAQ